MDRDQLSGDVELPPERAAAAVPYADDIGQPASADERANDPEVSGIELGEDQAGDLPATLRHWRVVEIDGEATAVPEPAAREAPAAVEPRIPDMGDGWIVARLSQRHLPIVPGSAETLTVGLLNNGPQPAHFTVRVEGWIDERWIKDAPLHADLSPGEWMDVQLHLALPRAPEVLAGDRKIALVIQSPEYPGHICRLGLTLTVQPFGAFVLGQLRPARATSSWLNQAATFVAPVTNRGNAPINLVLQGSIRAPRRAPRAAPTSPYALTSDDHDASWTVDFRTPGGTAPSFGQIEVRLAAAETLPITVRAVPNRHRLFGLQKQVVRFRLSAQVGAQAGERAGAPQVAQGTVACAPLFGPLHVMSAGGLLLVIAAAMALLGVALSLALRPPSSGAPATSAALPSVAIIVNMAAPVPTRSPDPAPVAGAAAPAAPAGPLRITSVGQPGTFDPSAPIVLPDQVSVPGAEAGAARAGPAVESQPQRELTYTQMFQEVALRYDLDWRLLAAQAYVESGFDTLAIGPQGALGLMQILPTTWNEWAPQAAVEDPFDAYQNVMVAAAYLDYLRSTLGRMGYPEREWMLVAYNWGPDKVTEFLQNGGTWDTLGDGVRTYATETMRIAETIPAN